MRQCVTFFSLLLICSFAFSVKPPLEKGSARPNKGKNGGALATLIKRATEEAQTHPEDDQDFLENEDTDQE